MYFKFLIISVYATTVLENSFIGIQPIFSVDPPMHPKRPEIYNIYVIAQLGFSLNKTLIIYSIQGLIWKYACKKKLIK